MSEKKCRYCTRPIPKYASICPLCNKKQGWTSAAKIVAGIFLLIVIGAAMNSGNQSSSSNRQIELPKEYSEETRKQFAAAQSARSSRTTIHSSEVLPLVKLKYNWYKGGFDNVMEANFTVENQSQHNIKDIEIKCTHFGKSGSAIDSNTKTIYDVVKAKSKKKFNKFNMGFIHTQSNSSSCEITDLIVN